jgi:hypothetical protein
MKSTVRSYAARSTTAGAIVLLASAALLGLGCQSIPPVSEQTRDMAHYIRAASPLDWSSRQSACSDARDRARSAARKRCEVSELSNVSDSCKCQPGKAHVGSWSCSAVAAYVCESDQIASRQP